jgi:hypothetical protein
MNADTQIQRRQLHFLGSQLYAGDRCLHFQRREACVDRVPAIALGYAANRHIGVADGLELLHSMASDDVVKRGEILIEKTNKRRRLCLFG